MAEASENRKVRIEHWKNSRGDIVGYRLSATNDNGQYWEPVAESRFIDHDGTDLVSWSFVSAINQAIACGYQIEYKDETIEESVLRRREKKMLEKGFAHLQVHTPYSLMAGVTPIETLIELAKKDNQTTLAITDLGNLYGAVVFYKACHKAGIKPIIGCEVKFAMSDKDPEFGLVLLAKDNTGYKNLLKIVSDQTADGRCTKAALKKHSEGLFAILAGDEETESCLIDGGQALQIGAGWLKTTFGDNFLMGLTPNLLEGQEMTKNTWLYVAAKEEVPLVALGNIYYETSTQGQYKTLLNAIKTGCVYKPEEVYDGDLYFRTKNQMIELFEGFEAAIAMTHTIAEKCQVTLDFDHHQLPKFDVPQGYSSHTLLTKKALVGLRKLVDPSEVAEYKTRLNYELDVIKNMGFSDYFLIVEDIISHAKSQNIPIGPGRGSVAGSLVAYCLGITTIDPIVHGLLFERFLNPDRITMPDIDIDVCQTRRSEVLDYLITKYGSDHVAQIMAISTFAPKVAIKDVASAIGLPASEGAKLAAAIPGEPDMTISKALSESAQLSVRYGTDQTFRSVMNLAMAIEGLPRHTSVHAAGMLITPDIITDHVPLIKGEGLQVSQYAMKDVESLGLLKIDLLGLRNLSVMDQALKIIEQSGDKPDLDSLELNDPKVYEMLSKGQTQGVFQLEGPGMTSTLIRLEPDCFEDIVAAVSLYRPGPMEEIDRFIKNKRNPKIINYEHSLLKPILEKTYGCIVYQEQVMEIFRSLAGYSYARSDAIRRMMSKKMMEALEDEKQYFINGKISPDGELEIEGCLRRGVPQQAAQRIWNTMVSFAHYAFNKSHAVAYSKISYQTAWLKCYYPKEYMTALLTSVLSNPDKLNSYLGDTKSLGIKLLPPDINKSETGFSLEADGIRFGLLTIKQVGESTAAPILQERAAGGKFLDLNDFLSRCQGALDSRTLEKLIQSGALDEFHSNRKAMLEVAFDQLKYIVAKKKKEDSGQFSLFDLNPEAKAQADEVVFPKRADLTSKETIDMEKESTGWSFTGHPLDAYADQIKGKTTMTIKEILAMQDGRYDPKERISFQASATHRIAGIINQVATKVSKNKSYMAIVEIEDQTGKIDCMLSPRTYEAYKVNLTKDKPVLFFGKVDISSPVPRFIVDAIVKVK